MSDPAFARMRASAAAAAREAREAAAAAHEELDTVRAELETLRRREAALERAAQAAGQQRRLAFLSGEPDTPGHLYRVERPAEAARALGATVLVLRLEDVEAKLDEIAASDLLLIWRAAWDQNVATAIASARAGAVRIVFDLDDLMIEPDLAREDIIDGIRSQSLAAADVRGHYERMRTTMLAADFCLASTDELATHIRRHAKPTLVLPNGFDAPTLAAARLAVRAQRAGPADSFLRIGYAAGSRTHQRDFSHAAEAVAGILRRRAECRLVLFRAPGGRDALDLHEFPSFAGIEDRVEWRDIVPVQQLPAELVRFDVNIVPLEQHNPFCEAKSELKFFEAALVEVPTVASATGPLRRAIEPGRTGYLASTPEAWHAALAALLDDPEARRRVGRAAYLDVLWRHGPERRAEWFAAVLDQVQGGRAAARAFELELHRAAAARPVPVVPDGETLFLSDALGGAEVCVIVPLYNYAHHIEEALESVRQQTLAALDLVVVDDCSTDDGLAVVLAWAERHQARFNRVEVRQNAKNMGLGLTRNAGFAAAETPFVLPLDADNRLRPRACERLLAEAKSSGAAFVYPVIREFGESTGRLGTLPYAPARLIGVPYIDAMALVRVAAWAGAGGYCATRLGWEDYDFWCRLAERGMHGSRVAGEPLAEYRVHAASMLRSVTETPKAKPRVLAEMARRHPWLSLVDAARQPPAPTPAPVAAAPAEALARLLPLLRCPETFQRLLQEADGSALVTQDGARRWPFAAGRPVLFAGMTTPTLMAAEHVSNALPEAALALIRAAGGPVLNLSAGGTAEKLPNVVEAEASVFRNTDVVADAHALPFIDGAFAGVVVLNAFEHFREPARVAAEIFRVLRPGGRVLVHTAFLQPLHEAPHHYYNCTRFGLEAWFAAFETERLHVSENFAAGHSLAWLAHEADEAARRDLPPDAADAVADSKIGDFARLWRRPDARGENAAWAALQSLPQSAQESIAAGFEFLGRRPG